MYFRPITDLYTGILRDRSNIGRRSVSRIRLVANVRPTSRQRKDSWDVEGSSPRWFTLQYRGRGLLCKTLTSCPACR